MANQTSYPDVYAQIPTATLLNAFEQGPQRLGAVLEGLTDDELLAQPRAGKWSAQQIACHLADAEAMGATRFRMVLAEEGCNLPVYDQEEWTRRFDYQNLSRAERDAFRDLFASTRRTTSRLLRRVSPEDWKRRGNHAEWGSLSLRQLLEIYADHSERHIGQILHLRSLLGKPLDFPLLLEKRLY